MGWLDNLADGYERDVADLKAEIADLKAKLPADTIMSPDQFAEKMRKIAQGVDPEIEHLDADELMCQLLESLGYGAGVRVFKDMYRYYA